MCQAVVLRDTKRQAMTTGVRPKDVYLSCLLREVLRVAREARLVMARICRVRLSQDLTKGGHSSQPQSVDPHRRLSYLTLSSVPGARPQILVPFSESLGSLGKGQALGLIKEVLPMCSLPRVWSRGGEGLQPDLILMVFDSRSEP